MISATKTSPRRIVAKSAVPRITRAQSMDILSSQANLAGYKAVLDGDWKLQVNGARDKVWLYDLAADPAERNDLSSARPDKVKALSALLAQQDARSVKPIWPSLLQGPVFIDKPGGVPQKAGDEYILWDN